MEVATPQLLLDSPPKAKALQFGIDNPFTLSYTVLTTNEPA